MISDVVMVHADDAVLAGDLVVPGRAPAVVLFAHGSGSSRHSPRNRALAATLHKAGLGTLLLDLLTEREEREAVGAAGQRDIVLSAQRLVAAIDWLADHHETRDLPVGLMGAGAGAAAALVAAAERPERVFAVVSRGGRPDLAGDALERVKVPVLLIVGGSNETAVDVNRETARKLSGPHRVHVVPGASHLFPEPGALEEVSKAADEWFRTHLRRQAG